MKKLVPNLEFKGQWRSYQKRVLEELGIHFADRKLHVVAAPGAGKTILGIEVFRRLGNPTLILSPTIVIKNQWKQRIVEYFLEPENSPDEISTNIVDIKEITTSTYQRLQAVYKKKLDKELIAELKKIGVKTLVLDEAHHLRTEWYKTLEKFITELAENEPEFRIISLTATPPYDVEEKEWQNYYNLCGPIDTEISIPELVANKDLCPHQDLLYFSNLNEEEQKIIYDFDEQRDKFFNYINQTPDLLYAIESSDFLNNLEQNFELIYQDTDFTIALISYLFSIDSTHMKASTLLGFLELSREKIPEFDYEIAENLFNGIIGKFKKKFNSLPHIKNKLKEYGLLKNASRVDFIGETNFKKLFARSQNKLKSIEAITTAEYNILGDELREVILLDYIGKDSGVHGLNILSAFKTLNDKKPEQLKIAVLTGTIVIIPKNAKELLSQVMKEFNIPAKNILCANYDENYYRVESYGETDVVAVITEVFARGGMNVLIGTHALLGEGWDSPCINSLIIGSVVGSFMLSNQMRGRALRIDKNNPNKTGNIWHLLSLEKNFKRSYDYKTISRRFDTFDGISYLTDTIESGFERLGHAYANYKPEKMEYLNDISIERAIARNKLPQKWEKCIKGKHSKKKTTQIFEGLNIKDFEKNKHLYCNGEQYPDTIGYFILNIFTSICFTPFIFWSLIFYLIGAGIFTIAGNIIISILITLFIIAVPTYLICYPDDLKNLNLEEKISTINRKLDNLYFDYDIEAFSNFYHNNRYTVTAANLLSTCFVSFLVFFVFPINTADIPVAVFAIILAAMLFTISLIAYVFCTLIYLAQKKFIFKAIEDLHNYLKSAQISLNYKTPIKALGYTLLITLCKIGFIQTPLHKINILIKKGGYGSTSLQIEGVTNPERKVFLDFFWKILSPASNCKYVLRFVNDKKKFILLPPAFEENEDYRKIFIKELEKNLGKVEIQETYSNLGKRELLKARYNEFIETQTTKKRMMH